MVKDFIDRLIEELSIPKSSISMERDKIQIQFDGDQSVNFSDLEPQGVLIQALIGPPPEMRLEEFYTYAMESNLFGEGTGGAVLGLEQDGKNLSFSLELPHAMRYRDFFSSLENYMNYLDHWKAQVEEFNTAKKPDGMGLF